MKKVFRTAAFVHWLLWCGFLVISVLGRIGFRGDGLEPLDYALSKGIYNVFILVALAGVLTSLLLVGCINNTLLRSISVLTCILFYLCVVLLFTVSRDAVCGPAIALWALSVTVCTAMLLISKITNALPCRGGKINEV